MKKHFYFKVNQSKLNHLLKFHRQLNLIISRLIEIHNIMLLDKVKISLDTVDADFLNNKFTLRITFNN